MSASVSRFAATSDLTLAMARDAIPQTVPNAASPTAPPTRWPVLSRLEVSPESWSGTRFKASSDSGTNRRPHPVAVTSIGPSSPEKYVVCTLMRENQNMPAAATAVPASNIRPGPADQPAGSSRDHHQRGREGQKGHARLQRGIAEHGLHEDGEEEEEEEEEAEHRRGDQEHDQVGAGAVAAKIRSGINASRLRDSHSTNASGRTTAVPSDVTTEVSAQCETLA